MGEKILGERTHVVSSINTYVYKYTVTGTSIHVASGMKSKFIAAPDYCMYKDLIIEDTASPILTLAGVPEGLYTSASLEEQDDSLDEDIDYATFTDMGNTEISFYIRDDMAVLTSLSIDDEGTAVIPDHVRVKIDATSISYSVGAINFTLTDDSTVKAYEVSTASDIYSSTDGVLFSKDGSILIRFPAASESDSYTVPDSTESVKTGAFADAENLKYLYVNRDVLSSSSEEMLEGTDETLTVIADGGGLKGFFESIVEFIKGLFDGIDEEKN